MYPNIFSTLSGVKTLIRHKLFTNKVYNNTIGHILEAKEKKNSNNTYLLAAEDKK